MVFEIVDSPTNRTTCGLCSKKIEIGERRLDTNLGSGYFQDHYHVKCFANKFINEIMELLLKANTKKPCILMGLIGREIHCIYQDEDQITELPSTDYVLEFMEEDLGTILRCFFGGD